MNAFTHFIETGSGTETLAPEVKVAPKARRRTETEQHEQPFGFTKVFRWPVPAGQTPQPTTVEVVGSFSEWRKVPLTYDRPSRSWRITLNNIRGNHTHQYVILVDGKPSYDNTCDGLAVPRSSEEARWQIETPKGPRVMLLFAQTR